MAGTLISALFGKDVFLSYSREDGCDYAASLANQLAGARITCIFDQWIARPGTEIPPALIRELKRCRLLVVIATSQAARSGGVRREIEEFLPTGRSVLVVDTDGSLEDASWFELVEGASTSREEPDSDSQLGAPTPSRQVLQRIRDTIGFFKRDTRLRLFGTLSLLIGLSLSLFFGRAADEARLRRDAFEAEMIGIRAQLENETAKLRSAESDRDVAAAEAAASKAEVREVRASLSSKQEDLLATEERLQVARQNAARVDDQRRLAEARRDRAVQSALEVSASRIEAAVGNVEELRAAVADAIHDFVLWQPEAEDVPASLHVALAAADVRSKAQGLSLGIGDFPRVEAFDHVPNSNWIVTVGVGVPPANSGDKPMYFASLWDLRTRTPVRTVTATTQEMKSCAVAPDGRTLAVGYANGDVSFFSIPDGRALRTIQLPPPVESVRFAPSGEMVVAWANGSTWNGKNRFLVDPLLGTVTPTPAAPEGSALVGGAHFQGQRAYFGFIDPQDQLTLIEAASGEVRHWNLAERRVRDHAGRLWRNLAWVDPTGRWLLVPTLAPQASRLIDLRCLASARNSGCTTVYEIGQRPPRPTQTGFSPDGRYLLRAEEPGTLLIHDLSGNDVNSARDVPLVEDGAFRIEGFSKDSERAYVSLRRNRGTEGGLGAVHHWLVLDLRSGREVSRHPVDDRELFPDSVRIREVSNGRFHAGLIGTTVFVWDQSPTPGRIVASHDPILDEELGVAVDATVSADGATVATAYSSGTVELTRFDDATLVGRMKGLGVRAPFVEWATQAAGDPAAASHKLYVASRLGAVAELGADGSVTDLGSPLGPAELLGLEVSRDGRVVVVHDDAGRIAVWRNARWGQLDGRQGIELALSADGEKLAIADSANSRVEVINLSNEQSVTLRPKLDVTVENLHFALSDERLVAQDLFGSPVIWDANGGPALGTGERFRLPAGVGTYSPGSLWAHSAAGTFYVTDLRTGTTMAEVPGNNPFIVGTRLPGRNLQSASAKSDLVAAGETGGESNPDLHVWRASSGEHVVHVRIAQDARRVEFLPDGESLLVVSEDGFPIAVPLSLERQSQSLCAFILAEMGWTLGERKGAYTFCDETFRGLHPDEPRSAEPTASTAWTVAMPE